MTSPVCGSGVCGSFRLPFCSRHRPFSFRRNSTLTRAFWPTILPPWRISPVLRRAGAAAGTYRVDIYLNDGYMTTRDVTFNAPEDGHGLMPCLTRGQLASMG
ncbi:hypothetical protein CEW81_03910 [Kluyvera genomosp. 3]|uniref:PapC N-terminal domain-containing protein n=1 Tax=Kluyvera genomosp. 3 TaxID=2774055 RepID=A0A248KG02_9ENTR|nr:hypothetical protein CEW81_03910 [Kluyvera genomosp. 3]